MDPARFLALALDPARILERRDFDIDPWQRDFLAARDPYVLLNCCRQAGKSTITAVLALHEALFVANSLVVIRLNIRTINEVRAERGYPPVPWGNQPLLQHGHGGMSPTAPGGGIDHNGNGQVNDKQQAKLDAQAELSDATGGPS